jgi:hypothetical protein
VNRQLHKKRSKSCVARIGDPSTVLCGDKVSGQRRRKISSKPIHKSTNNKHMTGNMQDKTKKKKEKKEIKLRDLKPAKDAKGGAAPPDSGRRPPG